MRPMIYTGYQWRPMKDDEIKIMDPWRVRKYKLEEPEAGDIVVVNDDPPYSPEDYADAKALGLDLDDWNDYQRYCNMGPWEEAE